MSRADTLRLLLVAEVADLAACEATLVAITQRIDELEPGSADHAAAHRRINELLSLREDLAQQSE